jgi:hypothetical protein
MKRSHLTIAQEILDLALDIGPHGLLFAKPCQPLKGALLFWWTGSEQQIALAKASW